MKILSHNVRGLGRKLKWSAIRECIKKEEIQFSYLQETKMGGVSS